MALQLLTLQKSRSQIRETGPKHVFKKTKKQNKTPERPLGNKKNTLFRFSNIFFPVSQGPKEPEKINANNF